MDNPLGYQDCSQEQYTYNFQQSSFEVLWPGPQDTSAVYSAEFCDPNQIAFPQQMMPGPVPVPAPEDKITANNYFAVPVQGYNQPHFTIPSSAFQPSAQAQPSARLASSFRGQGQKPTARIVQQPMYGPPAKRQKIGQPGETDINGQIFEATTAMEKCYSQTGSQSTCCSSCSEGVPCAEPDCQLEAAGACTECDGGIPRCNESNCFDGGFGEPQMSTDHHLEEEARMSGWDNTAWTSQSPRTSSQPFSDSMVGSSLMGFDEFDFNSTSLDTSLSPTPDAPLYPDTFPTGGPVGDLSGTGALFSSPDDWANDRSEPSMTSLDKYSVHRCEWKDENGVPCGQIREDEGSLQLHVVKEHLFDLTKSSCYKCLWEGCTRLAKRGDDKSGFSQRGKLERHMATHTGYKCCQCQVCGKEFSAQQSLTQHMNLHEQIKPWQCKYCDKAFPQQSACTIHERTHTGDKPLKCEECGKQFSESSNLSKHRKTHGERGMHCCQYAGCTKSFHRLDQLRRHHAVHSKELARAGSVSTVKSEDSFGSGPKD